MKNEKTKFWLSGALLHTVIIPVAYIISLIAVLLVHGAFGFSQMEGGTYLSQTCMQMAGGAVIGLGTGLLQKSLLNRLFDVRPSWIYTLIAGFVVTELLFGILLGFMGINRWELRFIEFKPLPEALIFAVAGLTTGALQLSTVKKYFSGSGYWILASAAGWGACILVTALNLFAFILGCLIYGAVTGAALLWVLKRKIDN